MARSACGRPRVDVPSAARTDAAGLCAHVAEREETTVVSSPATRVSPTPPLQPVATSRSKFALTSDTTIRGALSLSLVPIQWQVYQLDLANVILTAEYGAAHSIGPYP